MTDDELKEMEHDPGAYANWTRIPELVAEVRRLRDGLESMADDRYLTCSGSCAAEARALLGKT